jgi:reactive chlorine resistance protein C
MLETTVIPIDQRRLTAIGTGVLRYGTAFLLLMWGAFKFTSFEAEGIRPLVEHHPLMSWMYPVFGLRGTSGLIGVVEVAAGALMCTRRFAPRWSALGSTLAAVTFAITISFLFTTPGALSPTSPLSGFLMKDLILFGAALYTAGEARAAAGR